MRMRVTDRLAVGLVVALVTGLFAGGGGVLGHFVGLGLAEAGYMENPGPFESYGVGLCQTVVAGIFAVVGAGVGSWIAHRWMGWAAPVPWIRLLFAILICAPLYVGGHLLGHFTGLELVKAGYVEYRSFDGFCAAAGGLVFVVVGLLIVWRIGLFRRSSADTHDRTG